MSPSTGKNQVRANRSAWLYRRLLWCYPRAFREEYRTELERAFVDLYQDIASPQRTPFRRFWMQTLRDLAHSAFREWMEEWRQRRMFRYVLVTGFRLGLWAGAGVLVAVGWAFYYASNFGTGLVDPSVVTLSRFTVPVAGFSEYFDFIGPVGVTQSIAWNAATYASIGWVVEAIRGLHWRSLFQVA